MPCLTADEIDDLYIDLESCEEDLLWEEMNFWLEEINCEHDWTLEAQLHTGLSDQWDALDILIRDCENLLDELL